MKIFITGSSDGLGLEAAKMLHNQGHEIVLHARDSQRSMDTAKIFNNEVKVLIGDLSNMEETKKLAEKINKLGSFDTVIHNAGVLHSPKDIIFKVNTLAPYILTALMKKPKKLIYIGSNMHPQGNLEIEKLTLQSGVDYSTSKLQILMLGLAVARKWQDVCVNIVDPGWVKTKMANYNAPDTLEDGAKTQVWLASLEDSSGSGKYYYHLKESSYSSKAKEINMQEALLQSYAKITGIYLPDK